MSFNWMDLISCGALLFSLGGVVFVFAYAIFSKPNPKKKKHYGQSLIASGNGLIDLGSNYSCEDSLIMNGSDNRNEGTPVTNVYEDIAQNHIVIDYLGRKQ